MQYCPKCKTEYEDDAMQCADCQVALVPNLEDHRYMVDLMRVKKEDSERVLAYLDYSGFKMLETVEEAGNILIRLPEDDHESAVEYMKVYVSENMEEDSTEDYYLDEYAVETVATEDKVSDMKSTVYTFGITGAVLVVVSALNFLEIIVIQGFNKMVLSAVLMVLGVIFVGIAVKTKNGIAHAQASGNAFEAHLDELYKGYVMKHSLSHFYSDHKINKDEIDEGALYFMTFDVLKKEVKAMYPEEPDTVVNTIVERVYDEI